MRRCKTSIIQRFFMNKCNRKCKVQTTSDKCSIECDLLRDHSRCRLDDCGRKISTCIFLRKRESRGEYCDSKIKAHFSRFFCENFNLVHETPRYDYFEKTLNTNNRLLCVIKWNRFVRHSKNCTFLFVRIDLTQFYSRFRLLRPHWTIK